MVPSKSVSKTPLELWNGRVPNLRNIRIWGCHAYGLKRKMDKMQPRSELCMFVGYPKGTRGYYFYSHQDKKIFVSTNATFLEDKHIEDSESKSKVLLEEIAKSSTPEIRSEPTQFEFTFLPPLTTGFQTNEVVEDIESFDAVPIEQEEDPITYKEAMEDVDADQWRSAMESEMGSMYTNFVWVLVDIPEG
ncbi:uncharacterized protein [Primulina eburnea]|uniref:uncharacterized protein n=1 Tax=Primulina eburnea TaxID=1245227 RepID=UPI003C6CA709